MGWDISYHPISEKQINQWYFDVLDNPKYIDVLATEHEIEDFYKEKYKETIQVGLETKADEIFDKTHGYYVAVVQGFFSKFYYTRGAALSFTENPMLEKYFKPWNKIIPNDKLLKNIHNRIIENYCSGVFIPAEKVIELIKDYEQNPELKTELDTLFSHGRITVFRKALQHAKDAGLGLLEATEVIEPNPMNLNKSSCYSNLFNCDKDGVLLYQEAVMEQLAEIEEKENLKKGELSAKADYRIIHADDKGKPKKKTFWKKLFGK